MPAGWKADAAGLVRVTDGEVIKCVQKLFTDTHKHEHNWTQDRGCKKHGIHNCALSCSNRNQVPVPSGFEVVNVWRNQNEGVWLQYLLTRRAIGEECAHNERIPLVSAAWPFNKLGGTDIHPEFNEWRLLHGASGEACRSICATNFRLSKAGSGGTWKGMPPLYGAGIYFAERVTKADEYAKNDRGDDVYSLLICCVVGGRARTIVDNDIDRVGLRAQVFEGHHHSVFGDRVSKLNKPYREVVVYDNHQVFPEYLVEYRRRY